MATLFSVFSVSCQKIFIPSLQKGENRPLIGFKNAGSTESVEPASLLFLKISISVLLPWRMCRRPHGEKASMCPRTSNLTFDEYY